MREQEEHLPTLLRLAALEGREGNNANRVALLTRAKNAHPEALEPRLGLARYYMSADRPEKVASVFKDLMQLQLHSPQVLELLAYASIAQEYFRDAQAKAERLVSVMPKSAAARYLLWRASSPAGDEETARKALDEALELNPDHIPSLVVLARLAQREGRPEEFQKHVAHLRELAPENPEVMGLVAMSAGGEGQADESIALAQRAFDTQPSTSTLIALVNTQRNAGQGNAAVDTLQTWIAKNPDDMAARLALSDELQQSDPSAASAQYRAVLEREPNNVLALNNLAWNLRESNPEEALSLIERAAELAQGHPAVLDTKAMIEHTAGRYDAAAQTIAQALQGAPDNPSIRYHRALIDAASGNKDAAAKELKALLAADFETFPERAEASQLLQTLGE